jgi:rod shape-determining protein MreC
VSDRVILRRRLALAAFLVAIVVVLAVAGGPFQDVRKGISAVTGPVGNGVSQAVKPFKNLTSWIGDTVSAKGDLGDARQERDSARSAAIAGQVETAENRQLSGLYAMDQELALRSYRPVTARVVVRSQFSWYERVGISKGADAGLKLGMPVLAATGDGGDQRGLIGKVSQVGPDSATVQLMTNRATVVGAKIAGPGSLGVVSRRLNGPPADLVMDGLDPRTTVERNALVVTQGTISKRTDLDSLYPADLPIGRIAAIDDPGTNDQVTHVRPFVDSRSLRYVQVLTKRINNNR